VPTFAAVQAWAGADHRARVIAAVNVLNAAFMVVGALLIALLQKLGWSVPTLFALIGLANLVVAVVIGFTMPPSSVSRSPGWRTSPRRATMPSSPSTM
jgi:acyl-[acyl-carrier-protein]-phospholipid O-acyltransferase/long-chain-fatty-acid--[acyl-carrier-protein] ligase